MNTNYNVQEIIDKARLLGCLTYIPTSCGKDCPLIKISDNSNMIVIPDDITELNTVTGYNQLEFTDVLRNLRGNLSVIGGKGLKSLNKLFDNCDFDELDLSNFDTRNVTNMYATFCALKANKLNLTSFNTKKCRTMQLMFAGSKIGTLNLDSFSTKNVRDMTAMFENMETEVLDLSSFVVKDEKVKVREMLYHCTASVIANDPIILEAYKRKDQLYW